MNMAKAVKEKQMVDSGDGQGGGRDCGVSLAKAAAKRWTTRKLDVDAAEA